VNSRRINLTFHGVGDPPRCLEPGEDAVWIALDGFLAVLDSVAGRDDVAITFDDGNASDIEHALPALRERGLHAAFFVVADRVGKPGFLDASDVRALASAGMGIGSHGMRHRPWRGLDERAAHEELVDARRALEEIVERPIVQAACPFGAYDRRALRSLRRCGYRNVYTSDRGRASAGDWIQPRNTVGRQAAVSVLDEIAGLERPVYKALGRRAKQTAKRWR
jgi:peptidoglycan/xylan/chitin deacetylase (PgdA/CDA1 family)